MIFGSNKLRLLFASMLVGVACAYLAGSARASIIAPRAEVVDVDAFLASLDQPESTAGASGGSTRLEQPTENLSQHEVSHSLDAALSPTGGPTSTTSTSSQGGTGAAGTMPMHLSAATTSPDLEMVAWANGEASFRLPSPPGNDLLRPPQVA